MHNPWYILGTPQLLAELKSKFVIIIFLAEPQYLNVQWSHV